jgi:hypothetical protein
LMADILEEKANYLAKCDVSIYRPIKVRI